MTLASTGDTTSKCRACLNGSCNRFSTWTSSDQNLDFCTLLTVLDYCIVKVCCFCHCSAWVCCHSSHFEARLAPRIVHCMSRSLVSDSFLCCHFLLLRFLACSHVVPSSDFAVLSSHSPVHVSTSEKSPTVHLLFSTYTQV